MSHWHDTMVDSVAMAWFTPRLDGQRTRRSGRDLRGMGIRDLATTLEIDSRAGSFAFVFAFGGVERKGLPIGTYAPSQWWFVSGPSLPLTLGRFLCPRTAMHNRPTNRGLIKELRPLGSQGVGITGGRAGAALCLACE